MTKRLLAALLLMTLSLLTAQSAAEMIKLSEHVALTPGPVNSVIVRRGNANVVLYGEPTGKIERTGMTMVLFTHARRDVIWAGEDLVERGATAIDLVSTATESAPFCVAMTLEETNEQDDANAQPTPDKEEGDRVIATPSVPIEAAWTALVPAGSVWKYLDDGSIQGTAWHEDGFDDSSWASGPAELGYGDGNEATVVSYGMEEDYKYPTTYFRHSFNVPDASIYQSLLLAVLRDDGAVVYLNGTEIFRTNMPAGDIDYSTAASTLVKYKAESTFYNILLRANSLVNGNNVLAVEIHQVSDTSSDLSFDLFLAASTEVVDAVVVTDLMEKVLPDGLVAHWTFDERDGNEVYDAKGGNDGIIYGAKWVNGLFGGALSFDGDGDYISIKERSLPKAGPYSISLWLRADGVSKSRYIARGHDRNACWFHYYVSDKARFTLGSTTRGSGRTVIRSADHQAFGNHRLANNRWAHMVVVFDSEGKAVKFYHNSTETRNRHRPTGNYRDPGWAFSGTDVVIGSRGGVSPWYKGLMDDIRIYDRALSGPEVKELYQIYQIYLSGLSTEPDKQERNDQQDKIVSPPEPPPNRSSRRYVAPTRTRRAPRKSDNKAVEALRSIPGPAFLFLFAAVAAVCIIIARIWANADGSTDYPLPPMTQFDQFSIAALRGRAPAVIRTAVFSLWSQKLVEISNSKSFWKSNKAEIKSDPSQQPVLTPIEQEVFQYLQTPREPSDLFAGSLQDRIENQLQSTYDSFEQLHLTRTDSQKNRAWMIAVIMAIIIAVFGLSKLTLGLMNNRPISFLVMLMIGALVALFAIVQPGKERSKLGREYLKALQEHFAWLDGTAALNLDGTAALNTDSESAETALIIAVFGMAALTGAEMFDPFTTAFPLNIGGGCGGAGCGGGGGGCGGGGCGGCGG